MNKKSKIPIIASLICIIVLLSHIIITKDPKGIIMYLILPLPLNIIIFVKNFCEFLEVKK